VFKGGQDEKEKKLTCIIAPFLDIADTVGNVYAVAGKLLLQVAAFLYCTSVTDESNSLLLIRYQFFYYYCLVPFKSPSERKYKS
jgi:hypothetical protein